MKVAKQKRTGGFTLIELIVVIAILGILAGVGTVAYTGYVKAAHKGVDEQMISDVAYSMYLASYADPNFLEGEAYVVGLQYGKEPALKAVGTDEYTTGEAKLKNALEMSFGTGCTDNGTLALTYDGWRLGAVTGLLSYGESGYSGKEKELLGDIQTYTDALTDFFTGKNFEELLKQDDDYMKYLKSLGVTNEREAANATTLYLAQYAASNIKADEYAIWWGSDFSILPSDLDGAFNPDAGSEEIQANTGTFMVALGSMVAAEEAMYQHISSGLKADRKTCDTLEALFDGENGVRKANGYQVLYTSVMAFSNHVDTCTTCSSYYNDWVTNKAATDAAAYVNCLNAINESADQFSGNLSQNGGQENGLYTDGKALSLMTSYVSTAQAVEKAGLKEDAQAVAITVCKDSNGKIMVTIYKNGEVVGNSAAVETETIDGIIDMGSERLLSIGDKTVDLSLGQEKQIQVKWDVSELLAGDYNIYDVLSEVRESGSPQSSDSNKVTVSTGYTVSGNNMLIMNITIKAIGEGTTTVSSTDFGGGYTVNVSNS